MIDLTPWQQNFIRKAIHFAKMMQNQCNCMTRDDVELINFAEEFDKCYPDKGVDE